VFMKLWRMQQTCLKAGRTILLVAVSQLVSAIALAVELPSLPNPQTASGKSTTAAFYGAVSADMGVSFKSSFSPLDRLTIKAEILVEPAHAASLGNLYIVGSVDDQFYMKTSNGEFHAWDGNIATLSPVAANKTLLANESLTLLENISFASAGIRNGTIAFYLGYDTPLAPGELFYSGIPITFIISELNPPDAQAAVLQLYINTVSSALIQSQCILCHNSTGLAAGSKLVYQNSAQADYQQTNFNTLLNYILNEPNGSQLILSKPQGVSHGGGVQLSQGTELFNAWNGFVQASLQLPASGGGTSQSILQSVTLTDNNATLRKAALLFAGRLPSEAELLSVSGADEAGLRLAIRNLMQGPGFKQFLIEGANDRLLSLGLERTPYGALNRYYYPNVANLLNTTTANSTIRRRTNAALAREPLELISHVVLNELPYTEILTADYIMVNPYSAAIYGGGVQFTNPTDENEWRKGTITEYYRCQNCSGANPEATYNIPTVYPHAGLLNSPMFLGRFPSTETNRNRARARWAYYFFLGVDIEGLSARTTDPAALEDEDNPTLKNPNCTVCHTIMDPVAGTFQNYGDDGRYRDQPSGYDALPRSYKRDSNGPYQIGDRWYADMLQPGFGELLATGPDEPLQWLAQQFANDSRFGFGAVNFWYPVVMGREPAAKPENSEDPDYSARSLAYAVEQGLMNGVAAAFMAGTQGYGAFNLKDLLVDLAVSRHFRATAAENLSPLQEVELEKIGTAQLLTPEQLSRKLYDTTGFSWAYGSSNALGEVYRLIYGGIDSLGITERATELTTLMSSVVVAMANESSCAIVAQDFSYPISQRRLFTEVELSSLPTNAATAIRSNIQRLHALLLGEKLALNHVEIDASYNLFASVWQSRLDANKNAAVSSRTETCLFENVSLPVTTDSNQTLRAWSAVINYLLRDFKFIHE
jgi:hypothetical protein